MKTLGALLFIGFVGFGVYEAISTPTSVQAASKAITTTQADLKDAATMTGDHAYHVAKALDAPDRATALPEKLQEFTRSTDHLLTLRDHLRRDIDEYQAACNTKLAEFDTERVAITDASTARSMLALRRHTEDDLHERMANAQATLDQLDAVLSKGSDLQHAAKCVLIADDLHSHGEDLDQQLGQARQDAAQYAATTNTLLARINQALAD